MPTLVHQLRKDFILFQVSNLQTIERYPLFGCLCTFCSQSLVLWHHGEWCLQVFMANKFSSPNFITPIQSPMSTNNLWAITHKLKTNLVEYYPAVFITFDCTFSNSLIIHEEKTKEITAMKEVWICDPNYQKKSVNFCIEFL